MNGLWRVVIIGGLWCALAGCSSPAAVPEAGDGCASMADCVGPNRLACLDKTCQLIGCEAPADCPAGSTCVDKICDEPQCVVPTDCAGTEACWEGLCVQGLCGDRQDCEAGEVCLGTPPQCVAPPQHCQSDAECPVGQGCILSRQTCFSTCDGDAGCRQPNYCLDGLCRPPCRDDRDCPGDFACVDQQCRQLPDCADAPDCAGKRPYRDPQTCACVACLADDACDVTRQEVCTSGGDCVFCARPATSADDCTPGGRVFVDGCCADCRDDADCTDADAPYCARGRCVADPPAECIAQSDCTDGEVCDRGRCVQPPSYAECQTQGDCPAGEACYADGLCHAEASVCDGCPSTSRCVAEPGDTVGTCAGCDTACDTSACPDGQRCYIAPGAGEGYCVEDGLVSGCD